LLEPLASVPLIVVVLVRRTERLVLVGDVVLVSVLLDGASGFVPSPTLVAVARVWAELRDIRGRVFVVAGHEVLDPGVDCVSDAVESDEFFAVLPRVLVVGDLLTAGDVECGIGAVELALQVLDGVFDVQSLGGPFASVPNGLPAIERALSRNCRLPSALASS
jgi:hypothetical protein